MGRFRARQDDLERQGRRSIHGSGDDDWDIALSGIAAPGEDPAYLKAAEHPFAAVATQIAVRAKVGLDAANTVRRLRMPEAESSLPPRLLADLDWWVALRTSRADDLAKPTRTTWDRPVRIP
jgi:hypothetical protein